MKVYTQKEFDAFPVVDGFKQCPTGDYSQIKVFPVRCGFGDDCSFGARCGFGDECSFGERCRFGARCSFGDDCSFGERCRFGRECSFENGLLPFNWKHPYFAVDRIGSEQRKTYFFQDKDETFWIRAGCFGGDEAAFLEKLSGDKDPVKEAHYRAALRLAKMVLTQSEGEEQ